MLTPSSFSNREEPALRSRSRGRPARRPLRCRSASSSRTRTCSASRQRQRSRSANGVCRKSKPKETCTVRFLDENLNASSSGGSQRDVQIDALATVLNTMTIDGEKRERTGSKLRSRSGARPVLQGTRRRSSSNTRSRSKSAPRRRQSSRSRSSTGNYHSAEDGAILVTDCAKPEVSVDDRFSEPASQPLTENRQEIARCLQGINASQKSVVVSPRHTVFEGLQSGSSKPPSKKKQRHRSASTKRRSRPVYRETSGRRKREARAPSRSRSREMLGKPIGSPIAKSAVRISARTRSRSPMDHSQQWLSALGAEGKYNAMGIVGAYKKPPTISLQPSLSVQHSDDASLMVVHERIRDEMDADAV